MRALVLDFDGVLVDSQREFTTVAVAAWADLAPGSPLTARLGHPGGGLLGLPADDAASFSRLIPLGNGAEDFGAALTALDRGVELADQAAYDHFLASLDPAWLDAFQRAFFRQRAALRTRDLSAWLALHRDYPPFSAVLERHRDDAALAIATAKDRVSVRLLLDHLGLGPLFRDELIEDKETGPDKARHIMALVERLGVTPAEVTFVDDKLRHLEAVAACGARVVLAGWGHTTDAERARAAAAGFPVASLASVEAILFAASEGSSP